MKDHDYTRFSTHSYMEKAINSLCGLIEGIAIDAEINQSEVEFLKLWISDHDQLRKHHPFNELIPVLEEAISDCVLSSEEREDLQWLCEKMQSSEFWDSTTAGIQRLHAILGGIAADGRITEKEMVGLTDWLASHEHLKTCWPYDEIDSLVVSVLADGKIDSDEHELLKVFFADFVSILDDRTITRPPISNGISIGGLCAVDPVITFKDSRFCFTGKSSRFSKSDLSSIVENLGGECINTVSQSTNYLVVGADGNPAWAFACYGRKVEKAVELRKAGFPIMIIHEIDFHDAVNDVLGT
ncbi:MAG: BRCT domain-containing protein [Acidobacteria bacterium]|nr:BRCT domain-containing protein [Acidobacteriota bacterium]